MSENIIDLKVEMPPDDVLSGAYDSQNSANTKEDYRSSGVYETPTAGSHPPQFSLKDLNLKFMPNTQSEQKFNGKRDFVSSDCQECCNAHTSINLSQNNISSTGDSEAAGLGNIQYYKQKITELRESIVHLETVNSKLVPDLERYEKEIYELREQKVALQTELKEKDRECYNLQVQLADSQDQMAMQEKAISKEAGA